MICPTRFASWLSYGCSEYSKQRGELLKVLSKMGLCRPFVTQNTNELKLVNSDRPWQPSERVSPTNGIRSTDALWCSLNTCTGSSYFHSCHVVYIITHLKWDWEHCTQNRGWIAIMQWSCYGLIRWATIKMCFLQGPRGIIVFPTALSHNTDKRISKRGIHARATQICWSWLCFNHFQMLLGKKINEY